MSEIPSPDRSPLDRLGMFFMVWMGCFLFFNLLAAGLLLLFYGQEGYEVIASSEQLAPENLSLIRFLQIVLSIGIFGIPPVIFALVSKPGEWTLFKIHRAPPLKLILLSAVIMAVAAPLIFWALDVNQKMQLPSAFHTLEQYLRDLEHRSEQMLKNMLVMNSGFDFMVNFLMIAIVPAFVEELLFRGTLQPLMSRALGNVHVAILFTGIFFSFIHFQFYGFFPRVLLGILFGYLFYWSGNLWLPIFAHFLNNGVQVAMVYLFQIGTISVDIDEMEGFSPMTIMISTVLLFATLYIFDLASPRKQAAEDGKGLG